jgi:hypothetical protein
MAKGVEHAVFAGKIAIPVQSQRLSSNALAVF